MKTYSFNEAGKLLIKGWSFSSPDNDPPHRHYSLAVCTTTRHKANTKNMAEIKLVSNRHGDRGRAWWLTGSCDGFAGPRSRAINSTRTTSPAVFAKWKAAIESGNVEIVD